MLSLQSSSTHIKSGTCQIFQLVPIAFFGCYTTCTHSFVFMSLLLSFSWLAQGCRPANIVHYFQSYVLFVTKWCQDSGVVRVVSIQGVWKDTRQHGKQWLNLRRVVNRWKGFSCPRVPLWLNLGSHLWLPLIQCFVTLSHTWICTWCPAPFLA